AALARGPGGRPPPPAREGDAPLPAHGRQVGGAARRVPGATMADEDGPVPPRRLSAFAVEKLRCEDDIVKHMANPSFGPAYLWSYQLETHRLYEGPIVTMIVFSAIMGNFVLECVQRTPPFQPVPEGAQDPGWHMTEADWGRVNNFFNVVFLVEVVFHMYSEWMNSWMKSPGNWFDMLVVTGGCLELMQVELPGIDVVTMLRTIRVFRLLRALRIFGKIEALSKIINSLSSGAGGVAQALGIIMMVMLIYAVIAVDQYCGLYCEEDKAPYKNMEEFRTSRGLCFGKDYYGDTGRATYTMFQILTGESWSEAAVRPILYRYGTSTDPEDQLNLIGAAVFFVSFVVICSFVLINVVVAVLLAGFSTNDPPAVTSEDQCRDKLVDVSRQLREEIVRVQSRAKVVMVKLKEAQ
ncbi:unnamed protein product, partial [Prorocentrum cordatum]